MPIQIQAAEPKGWIDALQLVFQNLHPEIRGRQIDAAVEQFRGEPRAAGGLLEARLGESLVGAILVQLQSGRVASLFPPQASLETTAGETRVFAAAELTAPRLLAAATELAVRGKARMIQALLQTDSGIDAQRLRAAGFEHVADLLYLVSPASAFPSTCPDDGLQYEQYSSDAAEGFAAVVERTYLGTRDCPRLNGVRPIGEVLEGYRSVGRFDPSNWRLVRHAGRDVGCLLLAEHPRHKLWEIVYMGIIPEARGNGWGLAVTRNAQWLAGRAGAKRLVLAVDATNEPAIKGYAAAGFAGWDRRSVFLKVLE
jgi:ribosomal protein S18 acetylase RimI-like enzyme